MHEQLVFFAKDVLGAEFRTIQNHCKIMERVQPKYIVTILDIYVNKVQPSVFVCQRPSMHSS